MPNPAAPSHAPVLAATRLIRPICCPLAGLGAAARRIGAAACGTGTASTRPGALVHVSVAVVPITDAAPFMLAIQRGYFTRAGLDVTYTITPQSTAAAADLVEQGQALAATDRAAVEKVLPT
jgi:ABC-type nitrate/sulfonate/bicarbonate transport system substrate-binding protein